MSRRGEQKTCSRKLSNLPLRVSDWGTERCVTGFQAPGHPAQQEKTKEGLTDFQGGLHLLSLRSQAASQGGRYPGDTEIPMANLLPSFSSLLSALQEERVYSAQGYLGSRGRESGMKRGWRVLGLNTRVVIL